MKNGHLNQYLISLSLNNIDHKQDIEALGLIRDELNLRTHLQLIELLDEYKGDYCNIKVKVLFWGIDKELTARQASEELFEVACAILRNTSGINVKVLDIEVKE